MTAMAVALAELDGVDAPPADEDAMAEQTADLVADLVEPAKATALEKLGEGERGLQIANNWLRSKVRSSTDDASRAPTL